LGARNGGRSILGLTKMFLLADPDLCGVPELFFCFGQFKTFSKKDRIFGWNVLRSTMFQVFFRKIHQKPTEKMNL
jgi:hypothetical protein